MYSPLIINISKGFGGTNCQTQINYCNPNPCINGNCTQLIGSYGCVCPQGYAGSRCETYLNQCILNNPCLNNGICTDNQKGGYSCNLISFSSEKKINIYKIIYNK